MTQTEQTACILCSRNCGLRVETAGGRIGAVRGDDAHPVSKGYICQKAARLTHYQDHADRLEFPLRREPDGSFVRVSWEAALSDIASRLTALRSAHGGRAFAFYGGGGQGNHLGGAYSRQLMKAMKSRFVYSALAQEKTGDFWVNGRLFGDQRCHTTEDVEHADFVMFIGTNPFQAHGIPNARDTLRDLKKSASRTMVVVDPRKTRPRARPTSIFSPAPAQTLPGRSRDARDHRPRGPPSPIAPSSATGANRFLPRPPCAPSRWRSSSVAPTSRGREGVARPSRRRAPRPPISASSSSHSTLNSP
ncbi:MAG: molybdopterin-dependent oxidoreductase [Polyangiaceae bacterium]